MLLFNEIEDFGHEFDAAFAATNLAAAQTGIRRLQTLLTNFNAAVQGTDCQFPNSLFPAIAKVRSALDAGDLDRARLASAHNEAFARDFRRIAGRMAELAAKTNFAGASAGAKPAETPLARAVFGPVIERAMRDPIECRTNCFIDFETGALPVPPAGLSLTNRAAVWNWAMAQDVDAVANTSSPDIRGFLGYELTAVELPDDEWDQPPSLEQMNKLIGGQMWNNTRFGGLPPMSQSVVTVNTVSMNPKSGKTHLFRTRKGTLGLLQFLDYTDSPRGSVKIRYKLVKNALPTTGVKWSVLGIGNCQDCLKRGEAHSRWEREAARPAP